MTSQTKKKVKLGKNDLKSFVTKETEKLKEKPYEGDFPKANNFIANSVLYTKPKCFPLKSEENTKGNSLLIGNGYIITQFPKTGYYLLGHISEPKESKKIQNKSDIMALNAKDPSEILTFHSDGVLQIYNINDGSLHKFITKQIKVSDNEQNIQHLLKEGNKIYGLAPIQIYTWLIPEEKSDTEVEIEPIAQVKLKNPCNGIIDDFCQVFTNRVLVGTPNVFQIWEVSGANKGLLISGKIDDIQKFIGIEWSGNTVVTHTTKKMKLLNFYSNGVVSSKEFDEEELNGSIVTAIWLDLEVFVTGDSRGLLVARSKESGELQHKLNIPKKNVKPDDYRLKVNSLVRKREWLYVAHENNSFSIWSLLISDAKSPHKEFVSSGPVRVITAKYIPDLDLQTVFIGTHVTKKKESYPEIVAWTPMVSFTPDDSHNVINLISLASLANVLANDAEYMLAEQKARNVVEIEFGEDTALKEDAFDDALHQLKNQLNDFDDLPKLPNDPPPLVAPSRTVKRGVTVNEERTQRNDEYEQRKRQQEQKIEEQRIEKQRLQELHRQKEEQRIADQEKLRLEEEQIKIQQENERKEEEERLKIQQEEERIKKEEEERIKKEEEEKKKQEEHLEALSQMDEILDDSENLGKEGSFLATTVQEIQQKQDEIYDSENAFDETNKLLEVLKNESNESMETDDSHESQESDESGEE